MNYSKRRIVFDPNVREGENGEYGFARRPSGMYELFEQVVALEEEEGIEYPAIVAGFSPGGKFVYLEVDWKNGKETHERT